MTKERTFKSSGMPSRCFVSFLEDMKEKRKFCDVTFQIGGESISAHRVIVTAVIPYLQDVLSDDNSKFKEINIPDVEPSALKCIIDFAYTCELKINTENVRELLAAACFLGVQEVREECCEFMADNFEPDDILSIREFATAQNCPELLKSTHRYAIEYFQEISQTKDFLNYPSNFLKELLSENNLNVGNEETAFEALMRWTNASPEGRKDELPVLLRNIRLPLLKPLYLATVVEREDVIRSSLLCRDLVDEAKNYIFIPELRSETCSFATEQRTSLKFLNVENENADYILMFQVQRVYTVQHYNMKEKGWKTKESKPVLINTESIVQLHNKIYLFNSESTTEYDPVYNNIKSLRKSRTPRTSSGACSLEERIYLCGGAVGQTPSNAVECFDPKQNTWTNVKNMNTCRKSPTVVCFRGCIFAMGGYDGSSSFLDSVERYDPVKNKWTMMPAMLTKRGYAAGASLKGKLYICGGEISEDEFTESAEVYDPLKNCWELISPMNSARRECTLLSCGKKLYAIGGRNSEGKFVRTFDIYDPESGKWTIGPSTESTDPQHVTTGAVALLRSSIYPSRFYWG